MRQIHFATTNRGKVSSLRRALAQYDIEVFHAEILFLEPRTYDLEQIAQQKARYAYSVLKKPVIALDSGFYIPSLKGFPRSFVNFALETICIEGILKLVDGKERNCEFRYSLAYCDSTHEEPKLFESSERGMISDEIRGEYKDYFWSELFYIYVPSGYTKTLAEMTKEEYESRKKEQVDGLFVHQFGQWYLNYDKAV